MIIKIDKVISYSSQHPSYPAENLLQYNSNIEKSSWRCAEPGELMAYVILQLNEPVPIIGVDIGNYRSCIVIVTGSISSDPDNWKPIVNYQFMGHDDAESGRFKDQVQLFTRKEINADATKMKFDRVKITCMQSANLKVLFGISFLILRTEDPKPDNSEIFGRFKLKNKTDINIDKFKEKYLQQIPKTPTSYKEKLENQIKDKRDESKPSVNKMPAKRPLLRMLESGETDKVFGSANKNLSRNDNKIQEKNSTDEQSTGSNASKRHSSNSTSRVSVSDPSVNQNNSRNRTTEINSNSPSTTLRNSRCSLCLGNDEDTVCKTCDRLLPEKPSSPPKKAPKNVPSKPARPFEKLFDGIIFSLSGYKNPERDTIRKKAIQMGARYVADTNMRNHGCTHLVCAFKNTPKYRELKTKAKITSHRWVHDCHRKRTRLSWRKYALDDSDKAGSDNEEEIIAQSLENRPQTIYDQDTDSE